MIRYDEHAEFQIARRGIQKAWIELTLSKPDIVEDEDTRRSSFKCLPGRRIMLSVVTPVSDPEYQDEAMRVRIDQGTDAIYVNLSDRAVSESEEVADGIVVDYDTEGRVVGIEILDASKRAGNPETLKNYSFELPGVA